MRKKDKEINWETVVREQTNWRMHSYESRLVLYYVLLCARILSLKDPKVLFYNELSYENYIVWQLHLYWEKKQKT